MKKVLVGLFILTTSLGAWAGEFKGRGKDNYKNEISMSCSLDGTLTGSNVGIILSVGKLEGEAVLMCTESLSGDTYGRRVQIEISSIGVGLGYAEVKAARIRGTGIGLNRLENIFNNYGLTFGGTIDSGYAGYDAGITFQVSGKGQNGVSFGVSLLGRDIEGLGVHLRTSTMKISEI